MPHNKSSSKTETLRGRCEPDLKKRVTDFMDIHDRSESYVVRTAVEDFLERHQEANAAAAQGADCVPLTHEQSATNGE